jgi:hypothetical protein
VVERPDDPDTGYLRAEYDVPHCRFEKTSQGFRIFLKNDPLPPSLYQAYGGLLGLLLVALVVVYFIYGLTAACISLAAGAMIMYLALHRSPTRLEVTTDTVIIDGARLSRRDFGTFHINKAWEMADQMYAQLGYSYGLRRFPFGGILDHAQALEIATALNQHLRTAPRTRDEQQPAPEQLRNARPTDF